MKLLNKMTVSLFPQSDGSSKNAALNSAVTKLGEIVNWEKCFKLGELDW